MIQESVFNELSNVNLKQANEFLSQNINDKEVLEVEPGMLQYKVLEVGAGVEVKEHDTPLIHYTGKYLDGTVFGSSTESKDPISLPLDQTIPGFSKGLLGSREGEKRRLFIHPDMGYGTSGHLPPNSLLIFDVEVVRANSVVEEEALEARAEDAVLEEPVVAEPVLEEATLEVTPRAELSVENAETREEVVEGLQ
jgi:peptidylprolyl isomerase